MTVRADLVWTSGGAAEIVSLTAEAVVLRSETPHPPGSRVEGKLAPETGGVLRVKVHGSKKEADGAFRIEGRPIDLGRELREALVARTSGQAAAPIAGDDQKA